MINNLFLLFNGNPLNKLVQFLDLIRLIILRKTLSIKILRIIYKTSHLRLTAVFILVSSLYLPLALVRPDILLILGPIIYGYFHLISSYYFTQPLSTTLENSKISKTKFWLVCLATFFIVLFNLLFKNSTLTSDLSKDFFEILLSTLIFTFIIIKTKTKQIRIILLVMAINFGLLSYAWYEPLIFVSLTLLIHNWIAFFYWIFVSKNRKNRNAAIFATVLFGIIHLLIISGYFDSLIYLQQESTFFSKNLGETSWLLAPWSSNPILGQRVLALYTFGLSIHYFIWLKAIPENRQKRETPNSYREGLKKLKGSIGPRLAFITIGISFIGILIWLVDLDLGARIYFAIATLHAWLELNFLVSSCLTKKS